MTKREMRCPHKDKISDCSGCMAELNAMGGPASPEQFLREFAHELGNAKDTKEYAKVLVGWAKLLELREQEARIDELNKVNSHLVSLKVAVPALPPKVKPVGEYVLDRIAELSTLKERKPNDPAI